MEETNFNMDNLSYRPLGATVYAEKCRQESYIVDKMQYLERENDILRNELRNKKLKLPKQYIINNNATILFWDNCKKEKTIVKRSEDDEFNARLGFLTAFFQHYSGMSRSKANKFLANLKVEQPKKEKARTSNEHN